MTYQDKLGVYRVGDLKFYSKLEAIEMHTKTGIHPHWDFNEAVFSSYDWTLEPKESILELYQHRAQQLRDQYDYIILIYSGGADSETVLQSFVDNDIKLDEVASYVNYDATGSKSSYLNQEIFENAIPRIEQLKQTQPWIKHRLIDLTKLQLDYFVSAEAQFDWIYNINNFFNSNCVARESLALKIPEWANLIHQGKKLCLLWGYDKPRVYCDQDSFYMTFLDIFSGGPTVKSFSGQLPYQDELFFWTPDLPKLIIKQGHMIKNYMRQKLHTSLEIGLSKSDLAYLTVQEKRYWLSVNGVHSIIYPNYKISTISTPKPSSIIISPRDTWFLNLNVDARPLHVWQMGLEALWKNLPNYWKNNPKDLSQGVRLSASPKYYLERTK